MIIVVTAVEMRFAVRFTVKAAKRNNNNVIQDSSLQTK
jgi:hypothetical protein